MGVSMRTREEVLTRLYKSKEKQISTGFAERLPEIHQDLLDKIEALESGCEFKIVDVTHQVIGEIGAKLPSFQLCREIQKEVVPKKKERYEKGLLKKLYEERKCIEKLKTDTEYQEWLKKLI